MELERPAHGGFVVGRHAGKVVFVTGGLPGERVRAETTESTKRFDRARVIDVLRSVPGRVAPPCPIAAQCGGCDWQHATPSLQRELKTAVVAEQLARLGGYEWEGQVQPVEPLLGWRTRMRYAVDDGGRIGMRARRSHDVVPLPEQGCLIAAPGPSQQELTSSGKGASEVSVAVDGDAYSVIADGRLVSGPQLLHHDVLGHRYEVDATGFWQVHPRAAEVLVKAVMTGLCPEPAERALDLYCGVGLFAGALADAGASVLGVELSRQAVASARRNVPGVTFLAGPLERMLRRVQGPCDLVVMDPPRKGAEASVIHHIVSLRPRALAYVACDPAALGRDLGRFREAGWHVDSVSAFDLFPMTHHVECVAILRPTRES